MQLQRALPNFEAAGIQVFAVSYDPVDVLARFAEEQGITYPLLSDEASAVIRRLGILNTLVRPEESVYGIPYPGAYIVDEDGVVAEKRFYRHYRTRPSAESILKEGFGVDFDPGGHPRAQVEAEGVRLTATLGADALRPMQRVPLYVRFDLDDELHVYVPPVPEGFVAAEVEVDVPEGIHAEDPVYPEAHRFRVEGIEHEFTAIGGSAEIAIPLSSSLTEGGSVSVEVRVRYQACTPRECYLPRTETLLLDVPIEDLTRPAPRQ